MALIDAPLSTKLKFCLTSQIRRATFNQVIKLLATTVTNNYFCYALISQMMLPNHNASCVRPDRLPNPYQGLQLIDAKYSDSETFANQI